MDYLWIGAGIAALWLLNKVVLGLCAIWPST